MWDVPSGPPHSFALAATDNMAKKKLSPKYQVWVDARRRFHLSHMHVQMAREIGLNPKKLGKLANNNQEPWKKPLPNYIETLYRKHFKKDRPDSIRSIEQMVRDKKCKNAERKARKQRAIELEPSDSSDVQEVLPETSKKHEVCSELWDRE